jgi:hypothetical protein
MTESGKKWLIGCSVAAILMAVLLGLLVWGGVTFFKKAVRGIEEIEESSRAVSSRFGPVSEFTPDPAGTIEGSRVEAFLAAREIMAPVRDELASSFATLEGSSESRGEGRISAGIKLLPRLFEFWQMRNEACLEAGIGPGEYSYLYILSYYGLLGKPVTSGPGFTLISDNDGPSRNSRDEFDVREARLEHILGRTRNLMLRILRNQLAAGAEGEWAAVLKDEIALLEADPFRLPFRDGLPDRIARSLEPYRDRLEQSWNGMTNPLEFGPQMH